MPSWIRVSALALVACSACLPARGEVVVRGRNHVEDHRLIPDLGKADAPKAPATLRLLAAWAARELGVPREWDGAPPAPHVTRQAHQLRELLPLERKARAAGSTADEARAARLAYAAALAGQGHDVAAAAEYVAIVRDEPRVTAAWNGLATVARRSWRLDLAQEICESAIRMDPTDGTAHFNLALIHETKGRLTEADEEYLRALEVEPRLWIPAHNPLVVGNERAERALHHRYLGHGGTAIDRRHWDQSSDLAPGMSRKERRAVRKAAKLALAEEKEDAEPVAAPGDAPAPATDGSRRP